MDAEPLRDVDSAAAVPVTAPVIDGDFISFSRVSPGCDQAPAPASITLSTTRYIVVGYQPGDPLAPADGRDLLQLEELVGLSHPTEIVRHYYPLLLVEVDTTPAGAAEIAALPRVAAIFPALGNIEKARSFAVGLAALTRIAAEQRQMLPQAMFGGIDVDEQTPYPILVKHEDQWWLETDPTKVWPTAPAVLPVVNISVGPKSATFPYLPNDLVNLATHGASAEMLVVVAAGNCGALGMSPWAIPPWVLSVGATDDEEGTTLADYSSRGPADGSSPGPDLVACGQCRYVGVPPGTSFAAPRVSVQAMLTTAAFLQLGREVRLAQGARPHGVPLVGLAFVDEYSAGIWNFAKSGGLHMPPGLPIVGVRRDVVADFVAVTADVGVRLDLTIRSGLVREFLLAAATPMPGYGVHEVGAGFLDESRMIAWLAAVTGLDLVRWFRLPSAHPLELDEQVRIQLTDMRVFDADDLELLGQVVRSTGPVFFYDWRRQRAAFAPCPSEAINGLGLDVRINGYEVS